MKRFCWGNRIPWPICTACQGRIHHPKCTTRKRPKIDCCIERHKMLYDQGETHGRDDKSLVMYDPETKRW